MEQYELFNGRYTLEVGKLGGMKVHSNISPKPKTMRVYGKDKEGLRFVNLTKEKGGVSESYCMEQIKNHVIKGEELHSLTQAEIMYILNKSKPTPLLDNEEDITSLYAEYHQSDQPVYVEYLEDCTRYYTRNDWKHKSNGFLQYNYKVMTSSRGDITTNSNTKSFTDKKRVCINNLSDVDYNILEEVISVLSKEMEKRGQGG